MGVGSAQSDTTSAATCRDAVAASTAWHRAVLPRFSRRRRLKSCEAGQRSRNVALALQHLQSLRTAPVRSGRTDRSGPFRRRPFLADARGCAHRLLHRIEQSLPSFLSQICAQPREGVAPNHQVDRGYHPSDRGGTDHTRSRQWSEGQSRHSCRARAGAISSNTPARLTSDACSGYQRRLSTARQKALASYKAASPHQRGNGGHTGSVAPTIQGEG
jgi:hypothetical protein